MNSAIGPKTAAVLYAFLAAVSFWVLRGTARSLALLIVLGLAVKSFLHYLRNRME